MQVGLALVLTTDPVVQMLLSVSLNFKAFRCYYLAMVRPYLDCEHSIPHRC